MEPPVTVASSLASCVLPCTAIPVTADFTILFISSAVCVASTLIYFPISSGVII